MSVLEVTALQKSFGSSNALNRVDLRIDAGEILVLLGPSGCGKTTTLRCVAGLESPDTGRIVIRERIVFDSATKTNVPPEDRALGMVFQSYALWPHMTVYENVAFSLRVRKWSNARIQEEVESRLRMVELWEFRSRHPSALSGGQQQRVALARSLAGGPNLLLFDEPLSNLDARLRQQMRMELRSLVKRLEITALYVTHDQAEAMAIADRLAIMSNGRIVETGTPRDVYSHPCTAIAARFLGTLNTLSSALVQRLNPQAPKGNHRWAVRAECVRLSSVPDITGCLHGHIAECEFVGEVTIYKVDVEGLILTVHSHAGFEVGQAVAVSIDPEMLIRLNPEEIP